MALSQKHFGKMLVPWFNSAEWRYVKDLIFGGSDVQKRRALDIIRMWKLRTPKLPRGVEGTLIILDALLQDKVAVCEGNIQDLYGKAISRFLNLCGASGDKQETFYKVAMKNNIPDCLITIRHNVADDSVLPSQFMLDQGLNFCFDWVKREYWEKQNLTLNDCIAVPEVTTGIDLEIRIYCEINVVYYLNKHRILCVKDVASVDANLHERINECRVRRYIDPAMKVSEALRLLFDDIGTLISSKKENADLVASILVTGGSLFAFEPVIKDNGIYDIAPEFIQIWEDIINLLCAENMLFPLLKRLLNVSIHELTPGISKNGSLWLAQILKSLLFAKTRHNNFGNIPSSATSELEDLFNFDFASCSELIAQIETLHLQATSNPHKFSLTYLLYLLQLCNCPANYIAEVESLHNIWLTPRDCPVLDYEMPTADEVEQAISKFEKFSNQSSYSGEAEMEISSENEPKRKKSQLVEDTSIFEGCPLGVLAFQSRDMNPLLEHNF